MAVDIFIKIEGVDGESQDDVHGGEIDVLSWSWGMSNAGTSHMGGGGGAGKVNVQDLTFTKYVDKATPTLMLHCCNGKHIPEAKLVMRKAGEDPLEYLMVTMTDILVTSVSTGGSGAMDRLTETVSLNFAEVGVEYVPQTNTGAGDATVEMGWNIAKNAKA